jgi:hypothetical protein
MAAAKDIFLEHDEMLFKGFAPAWPTHIWDFKNRDWREYTGSVPKDEEWGNILTPEEFEARVADLTPHYA